MKKIQLNRFIITAALCIICVAAAYITEISASSADIIFSADRNIYEKGEEFDVVMEISADVYPGTFEGYIKYNSDVLEYTGSSPVIAGGEGILKIVDEVVFSDRNTRKYVLRFKAVDNGYAEIGLRGTPELYEFEEGYLMSVSCSPLTLAIGNAENASSDSSLYSLKISPGTLTPAFSAETTEYRVSVKNDVEKLIVSALASDNEATVSITSTDLEVGQNRIVVTVTAEDDSQTKYEIYCVREQTSGAVESDAAGESGSDSSDTDASSQGADASEKMNTEKASEHWKFYALQNGDEIYLIADTEYQVSTEVPESIVIPEGYTKTSILVSGIRMTAYVRDNPADSEFLLLVLKKDGQEPALYRYDRLEKTIQRYTGQEKPPVIVQDNDVEELKQSYEKSLGTLTVIIAGLCGLCMVMLIIIIRFVIKNRNNDELDD